METVLVSAFAGRDDPDWMRTADLRYGGQSWEIEVELPPGPVDRALLEGLRVRFEDEHEVLYGVRGQPGSPVEVRAVRLAALGITAVPPAFDVADTLVPDRHAMRQMWLGGVAADVPVRSRASIGADGEAGPMLVDEYDTTVVVPGGWTVRCHIDTATLVLEREVEGG
jgi:N-methylhydantoinase A